MEYENLVEEILCELEKRLNKKSDFLQMKKKLVTIGAFDEKSLTPLTTMFTIQSFEQQQKDFDCIVILSLSVEMMSNVALGCGGKNGESFILEALLNGKNVYLLESGLVYKKYKKTAFKAIYNLYKEYESKLMQYGIKKIADVTDVLNEKVEHYEQYESSEQLKIDFTGKKLLLETELIKNHVKELCCVHVDKNCIITPLAGDYIKNHHLTIKRI